MLKLGRAGGPRGDRPTVGLQIVGIEGRSGPYSINLCLIWTKLNYLLRIPCLGPRSERNGKIAHQKRSVNRIDSPCTVEAAACSFDQRLLFSGPLCWNGIDYGPSQADPPRARVTRELDEHRFVDRGSHLHDHPRKVAFSVGIYRVSKNCVSQRVLRPVHSWFSQPRFELSSWLPQAGVAAHLRPPWPAERLVFNVSHCSSWRWGGGPGGTAGKRVALVPHWNVWHRVHPGAVLFQFPGLEGSKIPYAQKLHLLLHHRAAARRHPVRCVHRCSLRLRGCRLNLNHFAVTSFFENVQPRSCSSRYRARSTRSSS